MINTLPRVVEIIDQPKHNFEQWVWVTSMARRAYELGADWVVNLDADEKWYGLKALREHPFSNPHLSQIRVNRLFNHIPFTPYYQLTPTRGKTIHRGSSTVKVCLGNHRVKDIPGKRVIDPPNFYIKHYPIRSLLQFEKKCRNAG